jgi:hypothetical protein
MKKTITGVVIGFVLASIIFIPLFLIERKEKEKFGRHQGQITGSFKVYEFLNQHFSSAEYPDEYIDIYGIKDWVV